MEEFANSVKQPELWITLNPNLSGEFKSPPCLAKQGSFLDNRIGRYLNVAKPSGITTKFGIFYFSSGLFTKSH
jgi:hypothetical protein